MRLGARGDILGSPLELASNQERRSAPRSKPARRGSPDALLAVADLGADLLGQNDIAAEHPHVPLPAPPMSPERKRAGAELHDPANIAHPLACARGSPARPYTPKED